MAYSSREWQAPNLPNGFYLGQYNRNTIWSPELVYYGLYIPPRMQDEHGPLPLIVYLHDYGERSTARIFNEGLPRSIATRLGEHINHNTATFDFVAIFPIDPTGEWDSRSLESKAMIECLENVIRIHNIDRERVFLTGMSYGANGVWTIGEAYSNKWAALIPVCSFIMPNAEEIKHIPAWVFHGARDLQANKSVAHSAVAALQNANADVRYTEYPELGHRIGDKTYNTKSIYEWLSSIKKEKKSQ